MRNAGEASEGKAADSYFDHAFTTADFHQTKVESRLGGGGGGESGWLKEQRQSLDFEQLTFYQEMRDTSPFLSNTKEGVQRSACSTPQFLSMEMGSSLRT